MGYSIPRGTQDILPGESDRWQFVEQIMRDTCRTYQYKEIHFRFLSIQNCLPEVSVNRRISCKKKCIPFRTEKAEA